ncbi:MAG: hypothetical protein EXR11_12650 [Rhodospirillaceae bacterium]|nr:hypothetical protein [Rhodospirillaceae bacterium]
MIAFAFGGFFARPIKPGQLALIQADGTDLRMLTSGAASSGFPSFAPDSNRFVYRVMGNGEQGLRIMSLPDGKVTVLTAENDTFPALSPRGDKITFTGFRDGNYEIYTIRPDGTDRRQLTHTHPSNDAHSSWSPDGKRIVFVSSRRGLKDEALHGDQTYGEIFVMRDDGSHVEQLTDNQWEEGPAAWLPQASMPKH